jgi:hypothetical protein
MAGLVVHVVQAVLVVHSAQVGLVVHPLKQPELHEQLNPHWLNVPLKQPELHEQLNPPVHVVQAV